MADNALRIVPLGGLGEIGMNCLALQHAGNVLVIDCGSTFPNDDYGVDVFRPDFTWLEEHASEVCGVFLTHGHEDHIGALPYLLETLNVPVWGSRHTLALVRRRLAEFDLDDEDVELIELSHGKSYQAGCFEVEPVPVCHSITDAYALRLQTPVGTLLHTGDFSFDEAPPVGPASDESRLREIGKAGVELLLSDSTNVDTPERQGSERSVGQALEDIIAQARARVFVALFASNGHRLHMLGEIAQRHRRKLCLLGRSLRTHVEIGLKSGALRWPSHLLVSPEEARSLPREELLLLAGGTQAERHAAMQRLAQGSHPALSIEEGDTVVFSSRVIPGNERAVAQMMNDLIRRGAILHSALSNPSVHTSGHAGRSEQTRMIELVEPRSFLPLHGTLRHMARHAELASHLGVERVAVIENGTPLSVEPEGLKTQPGVQHGKVAISPQGDVMSPAILARRAELGRAGVASVALTVDERGRLVAGPEVTTMGVPLVDEDTATLRSISRDIAVAVQQAHASGPTEIEAVVRRAARRCLANASGYRPEVQVHVLPLRG
jgi:ribonuclease J